MIKKSDILLILSLLVLLAGVVMSIIGVPYSDYVLILGAILMVLRGAMRQRDK